MLVFRLITLFSFFLWLNYGVTFSQRTKKAPSAYNQVFCDSLYFKILEANKSGAYSTFDTLYYQYAKQKCTEYNFSVFSMRRQMLLNDNYRIKEAGLLRNPLPYQDKINIQNYFRVGISSSLVLPIRGSLGWSGGLIIGWNRQNKNFSGWCIDIGSYFERQPFLMNVSANKDKNGNYFTNGFLLKSNGYNNVNTFFIKLSFDLSSPDYKYKDAGIGIFSSIQLYRFTKTFVHDYYHEYNYNQTYDCSR